MTRQHIRVAPALALSTAVAGLGLVALGTPASAAPSVAPSAARTSVASAEPVTPAARTRWRFDPSSTTMPEVNRVIGADLLRRRGIDGTGVGVAMIDTGVVPVAGLRSARVVNGPDLSFDGPDADLRHRDTYGHGTHLAGIIVGAGTGDGSGFIGVAPGATLTSVKVGAAAGIADVSQVIAAIDWVVAHRNDDPANPIRVLNLSYGTDGTQDYRIDPLTHAVENAWRAGIVVVVAAGNGGTERPRLVNPAYDPYVLAVGAADIGGTVRRDDDTVAEFSSRGDSTRTVDLLAPGRSIVSLRDPGSYVDELYPAARVGTQYTKGSGTSQAAAVVSGAVALLLDQRPELSPDQVKRLLVGTAGRVRDANGSLASLDLRGASRTVGPDAQHWPRSTGLGSLEAARGTTHVALDGVVLTGERHLFGQYDAATWALASSTGTAWHGGRWLGHAWVGDGWVYDDSPDSAWSGLSWSGLSWSGLSWSGLSWSGLSWSGLSWSGLSWSGLSWSGLSWSGLSWSGLSWSGLSWSGLSWSGLESW